MQGLIRVTVAWLVLMVADTSQAWTGELDLWGTYGERLINAVGIGIAGFVIWCVGNTTRAEQRACWFTLGASAIAILAYPFAGRLVFYGLIGIGQLGQCLQLGAWALAARKTHYLPGIYIVLVGMLTDTLIVLPWAQLQDVSPTCHAGMRWTCLASPEAAMALPGLITLALCALWLGPIYDRIRGF